MFLKKYKLNRFLIVLALTFFMAPSLQASAACFSCCPQDFMSETGVMDNNDSSCHDSLKNDSQHLNLGINCGQNNTPIMSCCLDKSSNTRLASDDSNKRPENNLIISSAVSDFNHGLLINNNYAVAYISFIAPPPQLEPLGSILKRE